MIFPKFIYRLINNLLGTDISSDDILIAESSMTHSDIAEEPAKDKQVNFFLNKEEGGTSHKRKNFCFQTRVKFFFFISLRTMQV